MKKFAKLKYPLDRRALTPEQGLILLAYDIIWRLSREASLRHLEMPEGLILIHDVEANLGGLGSYIDWNIGKERFEPLVSD